MSYPIRLFSLLLFFFFVFVPLLSAAEPAKPQAMVLLSNHAKTTYDKELGDKLIRHIEKELRRNYRIIPAKGIEDRLRQAGINDISTAERNDIIAALGNELFEDKPIALVACVEIEPVLIQKWSSLFNSGRTATLTIPIRFIDVAGKKYIYNAKLVEAADNSAVIGSAGSRDAVFNALDNIQKQLSKIIRNQLPLIRSDLLPAIAPEN